MTTKELVENFRFKDKTTQRDLRGSGEQKKAEEYEKRQKDKECNCPK